MELLIITQVFWPDTASTAQHLSDLADELSSTGHHVAVLTSRFKYEDTSVVYPPAERRENIDICRLRNTCFGKGHRVGRLFDILSFNLLLLLKLIFISPKTCNAIIGMTSPPLISFLGCLVAQMKGIRFVYWTMDLQPELAIASGLMRGNSLATRIFSAMGDYIFKKADLVITLDKFMRAHVLKRGADAQKVAVLPVWSVLQNRYEGRRMENPFRIQNGFEDKTVIMYSGNHSYVHPLDTLLEAALRLRENDRLLFVFIGDGVRKRDVTAFKDRHHLRNILQLPYQPRNRIHLSLGSADLQVVIMGDQQVGYTHANKVYGAMLSAKPVLYIGPEPSHVTCVLEQCPGNISLDHGAVDELARQLEQFDSLGLEPMQAVGKRNRDFALKELNPVSLKKQMVRLIEGILLEQCEPLAHCATTVTLK